MFQIPTGIEPEELKRKKAEEEMAMAAIFYTSVFAFVGGSLIIAALPSVVRWFS